MADARREFETMVEAVRVGTVIAQDANAARHWQARSDAPRQQGATGADLERAVAGIALLFPEHVIREQAPA